MCRGRETFQSLRLALAEITGMVEAEYVVEKQTNQRGQMFLLSLSGPAMTAGYRCYGGYRQESGLLLAATGAPRRTERDCL